MPHCLKDRFDILSVSHMRAFFLLYLLVIMFHTVSGFGLGLCNHHTSFVNHHLIYWYCKRLLDASERSNKQTELFNRHTNWSPTAVCTAVYIISVQIMDHCFFTQAFNRKLFHLTIYVIHVLCKNTTVCVCLILVWFSLPCRHYGVLLSVFADQWPWLGPACISPGSWNGIINNAEAWLSYWPLG